MTNYGPPGGGVGGPWRGQRPDDTPEQRARQPYPPAAESYPPVPQGPPRSYGDSSYGNGPYGGGPGVPYGGGPRSPYGGEDGGTAYGGGNPAPYESGTPYGGAYRPAEASPAYGGEPYQPAGDPYGGNPSPAPSKRGRGPLIAVLGVVLLLVVGGGAYWFLRGSDDPATVATPTASAAAGEPDADVPAPTDPTPSAAAPESSADPRFAKVGQCVRNEGPAGGKPKLLISDCAPKSYEVLRRIDGATSGERDAEAKCAKVEGYTNWYFFDSELDTLDFVLCLKQR